MKSGFLSLKTNRQHLSKFLGYRLANEEKGHELTEDGYAIRLPFSTVYDSKQNILEDGVVEQNQRVKIVAGCLINPFKSHSGIVTVNPELYEQGTVDARVVYTHEGKDTAPLFYFKAFKKTNLNNYDWLFEIKLIY